MGLGVMKKTGCSILVIIMIFMLCACGKTNEAPTQNAGADTAEAAAETDTAEVTAETAPAASTVTETEISTKALTETEAPDGEGSTLPMPVDTDFDYWEATGDLSLRYTELPKTADADIYAACVSAAAAQDARFAQPDVIATAEILDRATYTDAEVSFTVTDGDNGAAIVFICFLPVPEPEFNSMHPDYYFVLRTADFGKTWQMSVNAVCFYMLHEQALYFNGHLYLSGYSETNGGSLLYSNNNMDTCTQSRFLNDGPVGYIAAIRADEAEEHVICTVETTNYGYFIHDGTEKRYDVTCDLNLNVISYEEVKK